MMKLFIAILFLVSFGIVIGRLHVDFLGSGSGANPSMKFRTWNEKDTAPPDGQISYHLKKLKNIRWQNQPIGGQITSQSNRGSFARDIVDWTQPLGVKVKPEDVFNQSTGFGGDVGDTTPEIKMYIPPIGKGEPDTVTNYSYASVDSVISYFVANNIDAREYGGWLYNGTSGDSTLTVYPFWVTCSGCNAEHSIPEVCQANECCRKLCPFNPERKIEIRSPEWEEIFCLSYFYPFIYSPELND